MAGIYNEKILKEKIIKALEGQGFKINPHVRPAGCDKETYRRIQSKARLEQIIIHKFEQL